MEEVREQIAKTMCESRWQVTPGEWRWNRISDAQRKSWLESANAVLGVLAEAGLLAPAPLTEEWAIRHPDLGLIDKRRDQAHAERGRSNSWDPVYRHSTGWLPVDRAEGDGRADQ